MTNNRTTCALACIALLLLCTAAAPKTKDIQCEWTGVERIVAVGDVHGDHGQFVKVLRAARIIDHENKWIGKKTHLVQTGDVPDRGPDTKKALDLLMSLEKQAVKAGGRVHALIGNHEAMLMTGDLRYAHAGEIESFGGKNGLLEAYSPRGKYGKWILGHNAVIRIDDTIFVHGGIGPEFAEKPLKEINDAVRRELAGGKKGMDTVTGHPGGPLWYRGLAMNSGKALDALVDPALKFHKAKRIVIGHTPVRNGGIRARGNGKVIQIDVGMCEYYGGPAACLLMEKGELFDVRPDKKRKLEMK